MILSFNTVIRLPKIVAFHPLNPFDRMYHFWYFEFKNYFGTQNYGTYHYGRTKI